MTRNNVLIAGLVVAVAAGAGIWWFFIRGDAPPPVSLDEAVANVTSTTTEPADTTTTSTSTTAARPEGETDTTAASLPLDGEWAIDTAASFVGYRVQEELASIGTTEAVGRTSELTGGLTLSGGEITRVEVEVDMTTLRSDSSRRDGALRTRGLETDSFPTATFDLTEPIVLGAPPAVGDTISAAASGDLTLHGVTESVAIPVEGRLVDTGTIVVVGSLDVALADYAIEPPTGFSVLSIDEVGTIELQLAFAR